MSTDEVARVVVTHIQSLIDREGQDDRVKSTLDRALMGAPDRKALKILRREGGRLKGLSVRELLVSREKKIAESARALTLV